MPIIERIEARDFYRSMPSLDHETGDIWHNLPGFGLSQKITTTGIVISPACDLSQRKTETATVIPIISIDDYLYSKSFYGEIWNEFFGRLKPFGADDLLPPDKFSHPPLRLIDSAIQGLEGQVKQGDFVKRLIAYKKYIEYKNILTGGVVENRPKIEEIISEKKYDDILNKIFSNSFKTDVHFFPAHKVSSIFEPIPCHSVALFRYVYSIPIEILDAAQSSREEWWGEDCKKMSETTPLIDQFKKYPIKVSRLKDDFLSDLISRYLGMFLRLGSRDFTKASLEKFTKEMKGV